MWTPTRSVSPRALERRAGKLFVVHALVCFLALAQAADHDRLVVQGRDGPGKGKHVVLLAGDEEYRSEEALPQLAKVLSVRHGFKCTVLFSIGEDGTIDPERRDHQPGLDQLRDADVIVMMLRFRMWPEDQMSHFDSYLRSGKPLLALRTSTHGFDFDSGPFAHYGWRSKGIASAAARGALSARDGPPWARGFGREVLGESWVSHWGEHGRQATRGVPVPEKLSHPVLRGVRDLFVPTDVYEAHPPADAEVLMRGEVVAGMDLSDPPARGTKRNALGIEQPINDPMMPIVWTRSHCAFADLAPDAKLPQTRVLVTTMGSAQDLSNEGFRRLLVNGVYWLVGLSVPERADVGLVGDYRPSPFGFGKFMKGVRPRDLRE